MGLEVTGLVDRPHEYDFSDLAALPDQIADVSQLAPGREGAAVRLATVLSAVKPRPEARYITLQAEGGYSASVPLDAVADHAVILYTLDGEPLPAKLGGPLRFLIPDVAACQTAEVDSCASVKYLRRIVISAERGKDTRPRTLREHTVLHAERP